jgi:capsid portal protein
MWMYLNVKAYSNTLWMEAIVSNKSVMSVTDMRLYRYIRLHNGLCAMLVHDLEVYYNEDQVNDWPQELNEIKEEEKVHDFEIYSNEEEEVNEIWMEGLSAKEVNIVSKLGK